MRNIRYKSIPNSLRKYRKARGLTQKEVAQKLGLKSSSSFSRWERGIGIPKFLLHMVSLGVLYHTMIDAFFIDLRRFLEDELRKKGRF